MIHLNFEQYIMPYPQLSDAMWHSIYLELKPYSFNITVDYLYKKVIFFLNYQKKY